MTSVISATIAGLRGPGLGTADLATITAATTAAGTARDQAQGFATQAQTAATALYATQTFNMNTDPATGTGPASAGTFIFADPIVYPGSIASVKVNARATGTIKFKRFTKSGTTYTEVGNVTVTIAATGLQTIATPGLSLNAGEYLGFYQSGQIIGFVAGTAIGAGIAYGGSSDATTVTGPSAQGANVYQIQANVNGLAVTAATFVAMVASIATFATAITALTVPMSFTFGTTADPAAGASTATVGTFVFMDAPTAALPIASIKINARAAGTIKLKRMTLAGGVYTEVANLSVAVPAAGLQTISTPGLTLQPGEYLGFYQNGFLGVLSAAPAWSGAIGLGFGGAGDLASFNTPTVISKSYAIQVNFSGTGQNVTGAAFVPLQAGAKFLSSTNALIAVGNSLTQGNGGTPYPSQLATLSGRTVTNTGVGAQRAPDIFNRWGSYPLVVPALTIPASGAVNFTVGTAFDQANPVTAVNTGATFKGWLLDVYGTVALVSTGTGTYTYSFTRDVAGSAVTVPAGSWFITDPATDSRDFAAPIFWALRNSIGLQETTGADYNTQYSNALAWMERAANFLKPRDRHFLVLTELNRADEYAGSTTTAAGAALNGDQSYALIIAINKELRARFPVNCIDVRSVLVASYNAGNSTDVADFAADRVPTSLRADNLHLNTAGYAIVAQQAQNRLVRLGW